MTEARETSLTTEVVPATPGANGDESAAPLAPPAEAPAAEAQAGEAAKPEGADEGQAVEVGFGQVPPELKS